MKGHAEFVRQVNDRSDSGTIIVMPSERYKMRISIGCESDSVMKALSAALTICMVLLATDRVSARHWPDPAGGTVEGDLVLIRQNTIVIRTEDPGVVLVEIPYEKLRDLDRRFLLRKHRYDGPRAIVPESRLDFRAAEHGIVQQGVLRPGDPLAAAETVIERLQRNDDDPAVVAHIRRQAWECVAHLFPLEWNCTFALELNDERWAMLKTLSATLDIRWSDEKQRYVNSNQGVKLPQPSESLLSRP